MTEVGFEPWIHQFRALLWKGDQVSHPHQGWGCLGNCDPTQVSGPVGFASSLSLGYVVTLRVRQGTRQGDREIFNGLVKLHISVLQAGTQNTAKTQTGTETHFLFI